MKKLFFVCVLISLFSCGAKKQESIKTTASTKQLKEIMYNDSIVKSIFLGINPCDDKQTILSQLDSLEKEGLIEKENHYSFKYVRQTNVDIYNNELYRYSKKQGDYIEADEYFGDNEFYMQDSVYCFSAPIYIPTAAGETREVSVSCRMQFVGNQFYNLIISNYSWDNENALYCLYRKKYPGKNYSSSGKSSDYNKKNFYEYNDAYHYECSYEYMNRRKYWMFKKMRLAFVAVKSTNDKYSVKKDFLQYKALQYLKEAKIQSPFYVKRYITSNNKCVHKKETVKSIYILYTNLEVHNKLKNAFQDRMILAKQKEAREDSIQLVKDSLEKIRIKVNASKQIL